MEKQLIVAMRDYGYRVDGRKLVSVGIRGMCSDRTVTTVRNVVDAAEYLIPIIREDEYTTRVLAIMTPTK